MTPFYLGDLISSQLGHFLQASSHKLKVQLLTLFVGASTKQCKVSTIRNISLKRDEIEKIQIRVLKVVVIFNTLAIFFIASSIKIHTYFTNQLQHILIMEDSKSIQQEALRSYCLLFQVSEHDLSTIEDLCDGLIFSTMLRSVQGLWFQFGELCQRVQTWSEKLGNLRKVLKRAETFFMEKVGKGLKTADINLVEIAYQRKVPEIIKFYEVVLAVLVEAPNKQEHINKMMKMPENQQSFFVKLVQKIMQKRIISLNESQSEKYEHIVQQLGEQNTILREELLNARIQQQNDSKEIKQLRTLLKKPESEIDPHFEAQSAQWSISGIAQNEQLKISLEHLNKHIKTMSKQHELEKLHYKQQIQQQQIQILKLTELEDVVEIYKEKYNQSLVQLSKSQNWEKEKNKLIKMVEEKQFTIKKLQEKFEQLTDEKFQLQERQIYLQMELEKRDIRFRELQKQVRKRLKSTEDSTLSPDSFGSVSLENIIPTNPEQQQQIASLQSEVQILKIKHKESLRQRNQLRRRNQCEKNRNLEKRKLEKIILQINEEKRNEMEVILGSMSLLFEENRKLEQSVRILSKK